MCILFLNQAFLNHLVKQNILTTEESTALNNKFANSFPVFFQPIEDDANEVLFRTAGYIAAGYSFRTDNIIKRLLKTHAKIGGVEANSHVLCGFESLHEVRLPVMTRCQILADH